MRKDNWTQEQYAALLREELRPALGCTEPVSIALCAAAMTKALGLFCQPLPKDFAHFSTVVSAEVGVGASVMAML